MVWRVLTHPEVDDDLAKLSAPEARTVLKVMRDRIRDGEPDKLGRPLAGHLAGYRGILSGRLRIVYRVHAEAIEVLIVAVGPRRNAEVYAMAEKRVARN